MKRTKYLISGLAFLLILFGFMETPAQKIRKNSFKNFDITIATTGGFAGTADILVLDQQGVLSKRSKTQDANEKLSSGELNEIRELVSKLKLPSASMKTVKGLHIYDGIYKSFVITLDGKKYLIEGTDFDDQQYVALTAGQREIVAKIKAKLEESGRKLSQGFVK